MIIGAKGDPGINGTIGAQGNNGSDGQFLATYTHVASAVYEHKQ